MGMTATRNPCTAHQDLVHEFVRILSIKTWPDIGWSSVPLWLCTQPHPNLEIDATASAAILFRALQLLLTGSRPSPYPP